MVEAKVETEKNFFGGAVFSAVISLFMYFFHTSEATEQNNAPTQGLLVLEPNANISLEEFNRVAMLANPFTSIPNNGKYFTMEEIAVHDTKDDLWVVLHDRVFDITPFVAEHPGGESILLSYSGQDATNIFLEAHPNWKTLVLTARQMYIGELKKAL